jgi:hypothetical protein
MKNIKTFFIKLGLNFYMFILIFLWPFLTLIGLFNFKVWEWHISQLRNTVDKIDILKLQKIGHSGTGHSYGPKDFHRFNEPEPDPVNPFLLTGDELKRTEDLRKKGIK